MSGDAEAVEALMLPEMVARLSPWGRAFHDRAFGYAPAYLRGTGLA